MDERGRGVESLVPSPGRLGVEELLTSVIKGTTMTLATHWMGSSSSSEIYRSSLNRDASSCSSSIDGKAGVVRQVSGEAWLVDVRPSGSRSWWNTSPPLLHVELTDGVAVPRAVVVESG